jgi:integrase
LPGLNTFSDKEKTMVSRVNMDEWRSIDYKERLKRELELLKNSKISEKNRQLILRYKNHRLAKGLSIARVHREVQSLRLLCERYEIDLGNMDGDELDELLAELELSSAKHSTVNEYKKAIKYFLKFVENHELAAKIKRREPKDNKLTRDDLLSTEEVLKLISVAINERDPALIMCHLDLGCRPEEVLTLTVGDFIRDSWGIKVELRRSKTFRRNPHLSFSIPYVARWLEVHPLKKDPDAPVWIDLNKLRKGIIVPIDNAAYNRILDRLFKRAGVNRRFSPYKFRHTSITMWSVVLTEQQLSKRSGHIPGSRHLRRYAKLVDADADRKILVELGLISEEEAEPEVKKLTPVRCSICREFNEPNRVRCWRCKAALDPAKLVQEFGEEEIIEAVMDDSLQGIVKERLKKLIREIMVEEGVKSL